MPAAAIRRRARALSPIASIAVAGGPTKISPAACTAVGEGRVFRKKAVTRMNRLRARGARRGDDPAGVEIRLGRQAAADRHELVARSDVRAVAIGVGADRDRRNAHASRGTRDPHGDLAPIGDQQAIERLHRKFGRRGIAASQEGGRLSRDAAMPSRAAPCRSRPANSRAAASSAAGSGDSRAPVTMRLVARNADGSAAASRRNSVSTAACSSAAGCDRVREAGFACGRRGQSRSAQHQPARTRRAEPAHDERRDLRRCDAEHHLGHREECVLDGQYAVAGGGQSATAAHRGTGDDGERRHGQGRQTFEHCAKLPVVLRDRILGVAGRGLHQLEETSEVRAGAEVAALSVEHQRARLEVRADAFPERAQRRDEFVRQCIALVRAAQACEPESGLPLDLQRTSGTPGRVRHLGASFRIGAACPWSCRVSTASPRRRRRRSKRGGRHGTGARPGSPRCSPCRPSTAGTCRPPRGSAARP